MEKSIQSSFIGCYESDTFGADNSEKSVEHGETEGQERIEKLNAVLDRPTVLKIFMYAVIAEWTVFMLR